MIIIPGLEQNTPEWQDERRGKITGSKLGGLVAKRGTGRKLGFYELISERLGLPPDGESAMDRGHRLEEEAIALFEEKSGFKVDRGMFCISAFSPDIACSPDGLIMDKETGKYVGAVEVKCLSSARHIQALVEKKIPDDYEFQILQYFIVNDDLQVLHYVSYDPRMVAKPYYSTSISRYELEEKIGTYREYQKSVLREIDEIINDLEFN
jgi:hypothetical protein